MEPIHHRFDKRGPGQLRPLQCSPNLLTRADGSARFTHDKTSVICGVFGPMEVQRRDELLDRATIEVIFKPHIGLPGTREKLLESTLKSALEPLIATNLHPRTLIQISFQSIQDDGALLAAAFNAASVALMNAGIPLKSAFSSVCLAILPNNQVFVDPTKEEELQAESLHTFVFDTCCQGAYTIHSMGNFSPKAFAQCFEYARKGAELVFTSMKKLQ